MLKKFFYFLVIFLALIGYEARGQTTACDSVYDYAEIMPTFQSGEEELIRYIRDSALYPLINCVNNDSIPPSKTVVILLIDKNGKVIQADFLKLIGTDKCTEGFRKELLNMPDWTPAKIGDQAVCCLYTFPLLIHYR